VRFSDRERFSHYIVLAQTPGGSGDIDAERSAGIVGDDFDPGIQRYRPLIVFAEEPLSDILSLNTRARWEATVRQARGRRADYTVQGWRDSAGALWAPNRLVRVEDDFAGLHEDMLIAGVRLRLDDDGERAVLTVVGARAFDVVPLSTRFDYTLGQR
jgi:prophage tail gpP-like protein